MKRVLALLAVLVASVAIVPAVGAQPAAQPRLGIVHEVDASTSPVQVSVLTDSLGITADQVMLWENNSLIRPSVARASARGRAAEVVFVVDTSERLAPGGGFDALKELVAQEIRSLPAGTSVAVLAAGDLALLSQEMTSNLEEAAAAATNLRLGTTSALWDAVSRAGLQFSDEQGRVRSVVVVSSAADASTTASVARATAQVLRAGAQVIAVRFRGGDSELTSLTQRTGGVVYGAEDDANLPSVLDEAVSVAADRVVLEYPSSIQVGELAKAELTLGELRTSFSYTAGARFDRVNSLAPYTPEEHHGVPVIGPFLAGPYTLPVALVLALAGVALATWYVGSLVLNAEERLDGRLSRYGVGPSNGPDDEGKAGIAQTALIKRAVSITESIARDRGILAKTERLLERADMPLRPGEALFGYALIVLFSLLASVVVTKSVIGTIFLTALGAVAPWLFVRFKVARRFNAFQNQLPDALQLLAGTLRAGYSLPQGLEAVSHEIEDPMGGELRRVMSEARLGRELEESLDAAAARLESPDFAWAVMAVSIQREVGGNLNELLMTVSDTMVARSRLRGEIKALTAEGKLSAVILGGLPPALGGVMWAINPAYISVLYTNTKGQLMVGLAVLLGTVGLLWMKKVITIDV